MTNPLEIQDVSNYIKERVAELEDLALKYEDTEHAYPLKAGQFELLRLAILLQLPKAI